MIRKQIGRSLAWLANQFNPGYINLDDQLSKFDSEEMPEERYASLPEELESELDSWQLWSYIPDGYQVRYSDRPSTNYEGGPARHRGAICATCQRPLLLFWTLDCRQIKHDKQHLIFEQLKYLCIYYCPHHHEATNYRLIDDESMEMFPRKNPDTDEGPIEELFEEIPLKPLEIISIPHEIAKDFLVSEFVSPKYLSATEQTRLRQFYGIGENSLLESELHDMNLVGFRLPLIQGPQQHWCPNPKCELNKKSIQNDYTSYIWKGCQMKELAVISLNRNPNFPQSYCQITVHVCWNCLALHVDYACS